MKIVRINVFVTLFIILLSGNSDAKTYPTSGTEYDVHEGESKIKACKVAYSGAEHKIYQKIASNMRYEVLGRECSCEKAKDKVMGRDWYECEAEIKWKAWVR